MTFMHKGKGMLIICLLILVFLFPQIGLLLYGNLSSNQQAHPDRKLMQACPRKVLTFYYPWYSVSKDKGFSGKAGWWGHIDTVNKNIQASTHYPLLGAYDSDDPNLIEKHCGWAKDAGIDGFIVSWWGHSSYPDRVMEKILAICGRYGLEACIYYEIVPLPPSPQSAARDIIKVVNKYGHHTAYLKVDGKPVVFVYARALGQLGLVGWRKAIKLINEGYSEGIITIGDQFSYGGAYVFDGVHTYNTAGLLGDLALADIRKWAQQKYQFWVLLADRADKISTLTVIPGYDDTKIRTPGLIVDRYNGQLYRIQWEQAIKANPHWVLITSFNEWHEGSEIEPSLEYRHQYVELTAKYAKQFKARKRDIHRLAADSRFSEEKRARLRDKLKELRIGAMGDMESMAFWWLMDIGINVEILSWQDIAEGKLTPQRHPVLLYCSGESYRSSVNREGDVDDGLIYYLKEGGCIVFLPAGPWPFYRDENHRPVNRSSQFGLTLQIGWEQPPKDVKLYFVQPQRQLPNLPEKFPFPASGDLRWRPFFADRHLNYISLLQLQDTEGNYFGDAIAYAQPHNGGQIIYVWFRLLEGPYAEVLLYDLFDFLAMQIHGQNR